jgi:hypothetical protein
MIKSVKLTFIGEKKFNKRDAEKLRGFFGNLYRDEDLFHNHDENGKSIYRMPLIQYKVIDGNLTITAYEQGVEVVAGKFLKIDEITIDNEKYSGFETQLSVNNHEFYVSDELHKYSFESLWLPIKQENYLSYINDKLDLDDALRNNLLSNFKGLGIRAEKRIMVKGEFRERTVKIKNIDHFGFTGNFVTNVVMPDDMGVGRKKSIGFGNVRRIEKKGIRT